MTAYGVVERPATGGGTEEATCQLLGGRASERESVRTLQGLSDRGEHGARNDKIRCCSSRVKELGTQATNGPIEVPGDDMVAQCMDPQAAMFRVHAVVAE